jgi:hypothetical protein
MKRAPSLENENPAALLSRGKLSRPGRDSCHLDPKEFSKDGPISYLFYFTGLLLSQNIRKIDFVNLPQWLWVKMTQGQ